MYYNISLSIYVCVYIYIYIYIYIHIHTYIYTYIHMYIHMYMYMCISLSLYIYIYIHMWRQRSNSTMVWAKYYTPFLTKMNIHRKMSLTIHRTVPAKSTGQVTILWKIPLRNELPSENATDHPLEMPLNIHHDF